MNVGGKEASMEAVIGFYLVHHKQQHHRNEKERKPYPENVWGVLLFTHGWHHTVSTEIIAVSGQPACTTMWLGLMGTCWQISL